MTGSSGWSSKKIAQGGQGVGGRLDFVEKEHTARPQQRLIQQPFEFPADAGQVQGLEDGVQVRVALEVDFVEVQVMGPGELPHQGGFSHLARTADNQRLFAAGRPTIGPGRVQPICT